MKRIRSFTTLLTIALALALVPSALASDFNKTLSVSGGSPRRLSDLLVDGGYAGNPDQVQVLTICVPSSNSNTLYLGQSNVDASTGFPLEPGTCDTIPYSNVSITTSRIYLFVATTESEGFQVHGQG